MDLINEAVFAVVLFGSLTIGSHGIAYPLSHGQMCVRCGELCMELCSVEDDFLFFYLCVGFFI